MTLQEHLAAGYDFFVRGKRGVWQPAALVLELKDGEDLQQEARAKLRELEAVERAQRRCYVSTIQLRILRDAFRSLEPPKA